MFQVAALKGYEKQCKSTQFFFCFFFTLQSVFPLVFSPHTIAPKHQMHKGVNEGLLMVMNLRRYVIQVKKTISVTITLQWMKLLPTLFWGLCRNSWDTGSITRTQSQWGSSVNPCLWALSVLGTHSRLLRGNPAVFTHDNIPEETWL